MRKYILSLVLYLSVLFVPGILYAQDNDTTANYLIETLDGNQFQGTVLSEDSEKILLQTEQFGTLTIARSNIKSMTTVKKSMIVQGSVWLENTQSSRYFFSPNGHGLRAGEGYYQNLWVLFNQVSVGLSDNFSIGVGMLPLFLFGSEAAEFSPIWIVPKISVPVVKDKFSLGAGAFAGTAGFKKDAGFGIAYGVGTIGNRNNNMTLGLGYGYAGGDWANTPMVNLSMMLRTGRRGYILSENFILPFEDGSVVLLSFGGRTLTRSVGIDYGLFLPFIKDTSLFAFPWLGLSVPFSAKKK